MFLLKCGNCSMYLQIEERSIHNRSVGHQCPNCSAEIPDDVIYQSYAIENLKNLPDAENWEAYRIPDEAKFSLTVALQQG